MCSPSCLPTSAEGRRVAAFFFSFSTLNRNACRAVCCCAGVVVLFRPFFFAPLAGAGDAALLRTPLLSPSLPFSSTPVFICPGARVPWGLATSAAEAAVEAPSVTVGVAEGAALATASGLAVVQ